MQKGHMITLLATTGHGSYGNNITAVNIIDGVIKLADDGNSSSMFSKLNTAVNHNKLQVALQAWRQYPELHEKIAFGLYEFRPNFSKSSARCEHFLSHLRVRQFHGPLRNFFTSSWAQASGTSSKNSSLKTKQSRISRPSRRLGDVIFTGTLSAWTLSK